MKTKQSQENHLEDIKVNVKVKLSALWASLMFLIIYIDYFHLYMPGMLQDLLAGKVFVFEVKQTFLLITLTSVTIPALMIFLSTSLTARINRRLNLIVGSVYLPYILFNLAGEAWLHMVFGAAIEVVLLILIIRYSWKWPRNKTQHV